MTNQPQDMKAFKGQVKPNSGATAPKAVTEKATPAKGQHMKHIKHNKMLQKHNDTMKAQ